jgi:hypothetical protein
MTGEGRLCRDLRIACELLAARVREEYPAELSLEEIVRTFAASPTGEELAALRRVEAILNLPNDYVEGSDHAF